MTAASLRLDRTAAQPEHQPKFNWQNGDGKSDIVRTLTTPDGFTAEIRCKGEFNFQYEVARRGSPTIIDSARALSRPGAEACVEMLIEDQRNG